MKSLFSAVALALLALVAVADDASPDWPTTVVNSKGEKAFTVECSAENGVPTVVVKRIDGSVASSLTPHSNREGCQGEYARRVLASINKMAAADLLK